MIYWQRGLVKNQVNIIIIWKFIIREMYVLKNVNCF